MLKTLEIDMPNTDYLSLVTCPNAACAAANLATGTRKGEHET